MSSRKTTHKADKAAASAAKKNEVEQTDEQKRYAGLMAAHVLMNAYNRDHDRGGGMILHALKHIDTATYNLFYKQVQKAVADAIKTLEVPHENQATRKPRTRSAAKAEPEDYRRNRAAGCSKGKTPARKSAGSRTRKSSV